MTNPPMSFAAMAALQVAVMEAFTKVAGKERTETRAALAPMFAEWRDDGATQREVQLPDGTRLGLLSIHKGETEVTVKDPAALLAWVKANKPHMIERSLITGAASSTDLLDLVTEHLPGLVTERIRDSDYKALLEQMEKAGGRVVNDDGTPGPVMGKVSRQPPTGQVTYRPDPGAHERVVAAYLRGDLDDIALGQFSRPELPPGTSAEVPDGVIVPGSVVTDDTEATGTLW